MIIYKKYLFSIDLISNFYINFLKNFIFVQGANIKNQKGGESDAVKGIQYKIFLCGRIKKEKNNSNFGFSCDNPFCFRNGVYGKRNALLQVYLWRKCR